MITRPVAKNFKVTKLLGLCSKWQIVWAFERVVRHVCMYACAVTEIKREIRVELIVYVDPGLYTVISDHRFNYPKLRAAPRAAD